MAVFLKSMFYPRNVFRYLFFPAALFLIATVIIFFSASTRAAAQTGRGDTVFEAKCRACHTIGGGRSVGPDLKGVSERREHSWLISFITTPDKLILQGDSIAQQLVKEYNLPMPNLSISDADAEAILEYIATYSPSAPPPTSTPPTPPVSTPPTTTPITYDANAGTDLFTGRLAFRNGGPACLSCHNINAAGTIGGGTVGKDLSDVYSVMGEAALTSILKTTPFPIMTDIYSVKPLTEDEISAVLAFLKDASEAPSTSSQNPSLFFIIGIAGAAILIGFFQLLWRGRLSGVRRTLVKGGSK